MHYQVGNQTFTNKFLAASHAVKTSQDMHFNLHESVFDHADWSYEPTQSWDSLLDIRAQQIASKGRPIVLYFSGGTDSYTIYKVFERNNIHLDLIYMRRRLGTMDSAMHKRVLELLNKGVYDPTTKIIVRDDDESLFADAYSNPDWIWTKNLRWQFGIGFAGDHVSNEYVSQELGRDDFIAVMGYEKPRILIDYNGVYSYQTDLAYFRQMEQPNTDCFYVSPELPELHIKQSYMLARFIRSLRPTDKAKDLKEFSLSVDNPNKFDWDTYAVACGRYGDLSCSGKVQSAWHNMSLRKPNGRFDGSEHTGLEIDWFKSLQGTKTFKNYIDGLLSFRNDSVGKFLETNPNDLYSMRGFWSKLYRLNNSIMKPIA
jgi:hypothetical protein